MSQSPVHIACPKNLAVDFSLSVRALAVSLMIPAPTPCDTISGGQGEVCKKGDSRDEGCQNVEQALLLVI